MAVTEMPEAPLDWLIFAARYVLRRVHVHPRHLRHDLSATYVQATILLDELTEWRIVAADRGPMGRVVCVALRHADHVTQVLREHAGVVPDPNPLVSLLLPPATGRQRHVLQLVAEGKSRQQMAAELHLSENTIKTHVRRLYRLLDAHGSSANLVHQAHLKGLLPQPHLPATSGKDSR
jgi:DNA-binding CsgD family transcriptional regulator